MPRSWQCIYDEESGGDRHVDGLSMKIATIIDVLQIPSSGASALQIASTMEGGEVNKFPRPPQCVYARRRP